MKPLNSLPALAALATTVLLLDSVAAAGYTIPLKSRGMDNSDDVKWRLPGRSRRRSAPTDVPGAHVNVDLTEFFNRTDCQWWTTFHVGTPRQEISLIFDTGSTDILLPSSACTDCAPHRLFAYNESSTYTALGGGVEYNISFGTGVDSVPFSTPQGARCGFGADTVALGVSGDLVVANQSFLICDEYAPALDNMPIDGIIGMGLPGAAATGTAWFWNLVGAGTFDSSVFSFYIPGLNLSSSNSSRQAGNDDGTGAELTLGGVDASKFTGPVRWTNLSAAGAAAYSSWGIELTGLYVDGVAFDLSVANASNATALRNIAILDTGTAFMSPPDFATVERLYAAISPNITLIDPAGAYGAPCDELEALAPDLTFTLGESSSSLSNGTHSAAQQNLTIPAASFNLGEYPGQPGVCQALFNGPAVGADIVEAGEEPWVVGSPLLKQYYTVWDAENMRVGWAELYKGA